MSQPLLDNEELEIVEQGEAARFLLDNPMFLRAIDAVRAQCAEAILTSSPQAKDAREDAYNLSRGLSAITTELADLDARAQSILAQAEAQTETVDQDIPVDEPPADY